MNWANVLRRWSRRSIHCMILGGALIGPANMGSAQTPGTISSKLPRQNFTRSMSYDLPVEINPQTGANLSSVRLYTKTPTTSWKLQEVGEPFVTRFSCKVTQEGEYWYSLVMVDRLGRMTPADVNLAPPLQRVVVDTTAPVIQVKSVPGPNDSLCLMCTMEDANPDQSSWKAVCKTETGEIPLESVPDQPGLFRLKGSEPMRYPVIVSAADLAKNVGTRQVNVGELPGSALHTAKQPGKTPSDLALTSGAAPTLPPPRMDVPPQILASPDLSPKGVSPPIAASQGLPPKAEMPLFPGLPNQVELPTPPALNQIAAVTNFKPVVTESAYKQPTPNPLPTGEQPSRGSVPYQLINTTHATVDYRIDHVGPSGLGKVEIYMTPDKGDSWHRLGEDSDKRSPAEINLPGDGVYGIRIVITNGNGFGGRAPVRGDAPHCNIEVDSTCPFVQIRSAEVNPGAGHIEIRWNATDRNLGSTPINLFYRTRLDGPWQVVARDLKNDGLHRWTFPRDNSTQLFFKIEVTDQAGNVSHDTTRQPVVIDMSEPRATVVSVTGSGTARPAP